MRYIKLKHSKKLLFKTPKNKLFFDYCLLDKDTTAVSFRTILNVPCQTMNVDAFFRFDATGITHISLIGLVSDSRFNYLLFWDIFHTLPIGAKIIVIEEFDYDTAYDKRYYEKCIRLEKQYTKNGFNFREYLKIDASMVEKESGLDEWSFGIPTGPGDPTFLNASVKRILELPIKKKEIILCGIPSVDFKYFDKVKIVGEDIPAPPVHITKKKNLIVKSASYKNLCIIHDRVLLPLNFIDAMQKYGDRFSFLGFTSLYFQDTANFYGFRYSDYAIALGNINFLKTYLSKNSSTNIFSKEVFSNFEKSINISTMYANEYYGNAYLTGSLYIFKKSLWEFVPQNEKLFWAEFEDLEQGFYAYDSGVPSRINPYAYTQTLFARVLLNLPQHLLKSLSGGKSSITRFKQSILTKVIGIFFEKKPLLKISELNYKKQLLKFASIYLKEYDFYTIQVFLTKNTRITQFQILLLTTYILKNITYNLLDKTFQQKLTNDLEKYIFNELIPYSMKEYIKTSIYSSKDIYQGIVSDRGIFTKIISKDFRKKLFFNNMRDYFVEDSLKVKIGTFLFVLFLKLSRRKDIYKDNFWTMYNNIVFSTPFKKLLTDD